MFSFLVFALLGFGLVFLGFRVLERGLLISPKRGLRVLMYHRIFGDADTTQRDNLFVSQSTFESQLRWLLQEGYRPLRLGELLEQIEGSHPRFSDDTFLITFDDGYRDNLLLALPVLEALQIPAVIFLVSSFTENAEAEEDRNYLNLSELRQLSDSGLIDFALHSHGHLNYRDLSTQDTAALESDIAAVQTYYRSHQIPFLPALAYPYGAIPRKDPAALKCLTETLANQGVKLGFRIGNQVNTGSIQQPYFIQRIDIKGSDSFSVFQIKMKKGRAKLFA